MPDAEALSEDIPPGMWRGRNVASAPQCGTGTVHSRVKCSARCVAVSRTPRRPFKMGGERSRLGNRKSAQGPFRPGRSRYRLLQRRLERPRD